MNYRHIYHAGNICDVIKHALLALCLDYLRQKDKGFCVLDTHAGVGLYDLNDERAKKTGEADGGIQKLWQIPTIAGIASYYALLRKLNLDTQSPEPLTVYPGSPVLTALSLRPQDRLIACELHPDDVNDLRRALHPYLNAHTHHRDGYEALGAFLPPPEKRGLVLIDPPFEKPDEFDTLAKRVIDGYSRWPQGMFLVWYPIKERPTLWQFHEKLVAAGIPKILCAEFIFDEETRHDRLNGSGAIIINPPWTMAEQLPPLFAELHNTLETRHHGVTVKWLTG